MKGEGEVLEVWFCCSHQLAIAVSLLQDLDHLEQIWELTQEWETAWDSWKVGTFGSLQTDKMGIDAQNILKKLTKVAREVKV